MFLTIAAGLFTMRSVQKIMRLMGSVLRQIFLQRLFRYYLFSHFTSKLSLFLLLKHSQKPFSAYINEGKSLKILKWSPPGFHKKLYHHHHQGTILKMFRYKRYRRYHTSYIPSVLYYHFPSPPPHPLCTIKNRLSKCTWLVTGLPTSLAKLRWLRAPLSCQVSVKYAQQ